MQEITKKKQGTVGEKCHVSVSQQCLFLTDRQTLVCACKPKATSSQGTIAGNSLRVETYQHAFLHCTLARGPLTTALPSFLYTLIHHFACMLV